MFKIRVSFDSVAEIYDKTRGPPNHAMKQLIKTIANELKGYRIILDAGVGTGRFAKPLQDNGFKVVGIDIAGKMLNKAKEKGVGILLHGDACFLPFKDNIFDAAVCIHLLHLVSGWEMVLQEICRVTRETMLSITYASKNPVRQAYNRILKGYGYEKRRLGKGEWELKELVKPSKSVFATAFDNSVDELIEHLSQRAYSGQWEISEDINKKVVDELRLRFSGKVFSAELRVLVWDIEDLKDYCSPFKSASS